MKICRFCLAENVTLLNLYEKFEEDVDIQRKASAVTNFEVKEKQFILRFLN